MIICVDDQIMLKGNVIDLVTDVAGILEEFRNAVEEEFNEDVADRLVVAVGKMIYMTPEDDAKNGYAVTKEIVDLVHQMAEIKRKEKE